MDASEYISPAEANLQSEGKVPFFKFVVSMSLQSSKLNVLLWQYLMRPPPLGLNYSWLVDPVQERLPLWHESIRISASVGFKWLPVSYMSVYLRRDISDPKQN